MPGAAPAEIGEACPALEQPEMRLGRSNSLKLPKALQAFFPKILPAFFARQSFFFAFLVGF